MQTYFKQTAHINRNRVLNMTGICKHPSLSDKKRVLYDAKTHLKNSRNRKLYPRLIFLESFPTYVSQLT